MALSRRIARDPGLVIFGLLMVFFLAVLCLVAAVGCSSGGKKSGERVTAPHSVPELLQALAEAEAMLGLTYKGDGIKVAYETGTTKYPTGWWGETKTINGVTSTLGGVTYRGSFMTLYTDPRTGKPHPVSSRWEMARAILYTNGYTTEAAQRDLMRKAGFRY